MTSRERIARLLRFQEADRIGIAESLFWGSTIEAWREQGLAVEGNIYHTFDLDVHRVRAELNLGLPIETVEETEDYVLYRSADGVLEKKFRVNSEERGVQHLDYLIKTPDDWFRFKSRMTPGGRVDDRYIKEWREYYSRDRFVFFYLRGPFWSACNKMDFVQFNYWMFDHEDVVRDMLETETDLILGIWEEATRLGLRFDGAYILDVMGMKEATYISPALYRSLVKPFHERICTFFRDKGYPVMLHSDGNVEALLPSLVDAGFTALTPVESRAGMDLVKLKQTYGDRLAFMGGIDADILSTDDRDLIEQEVMTKTLAAKQGGGFVFHSDGSVPPTISLESYRFALDLALAHGTYR